MMRTIDERRSVVKAATYRVLMMFLDFITIYLMTGTVHIAVGFMIVSNISTTIAYFGHERIWARIKWGVSRT